jgi:hypothetical protein
MYITKPLDAPEALELLREVVAEYGKGYVYDRRPGETHACVYIRDGQPSCLIAIALFRSGRFLIEDLARLDDEDGDVVNAGAIRDCCEGRFVDRITDDAVLILNTAQARQDSKEPWGNALASAENEFLLLFPYTESR